MVIPKKMRFSLITLAILLFILVSCDVKPYVQEPVVTPTPTDVPVGPYSVTLKSIDPENKLEYKISDPIFWVGSRRIKKTEVVTEGDVYHLFCNPGERLSVWADNFFIEQIFCQGENEIFLDRYLLTDNANYPWSGSNDCAGCHITRTDDLTGRYHNEYPEWQSSSHSRSFTNPYFQSVYLGTGGPPGFLLDYPADFGNCAFCHVPAILDPPQLEAQLKHFFNSQPYPATEGVTCDVCHKVVSVNLQENQEFKNKPYHDRPGVLGYNFLRPEPTTVRRYVGPHIYANLEDFENPNSGNRITYSPIYEKSEFCAPCHYGKFWETEVYNSYGEWLDSAYAQDGTTCQDCHMNPGYLCGESGDDNVGTGVITHDMTVRECMLKETATMDVNASYEKGKDRIAVTVTLKNENAGHNFPTDSPLRQLVLLVEAEDQFGNNLYQVGGEVIPLWGGVGNVAGKPGKIFANLLIEEYFNPRYNTDISPTIAYWNKTKPAWKNSDTRLKPKFYNAEGAVEYDPDESTYYFAAPFPVSGKINATVTVRLYYRYAYFDLMIQKGWNRPDILLHQWIGEVQE